MHWLHDSSAKFKYILKTFEIKTLLGLEHTKKKLKPPLVDEQGKSHVTQIIPVAACK